MTQQTIPFDDSSFNVETLTIESAEDRIAVYGNLTLERDKQGLAKAQILADYFQKVVNQLKSEDKKGTLSEIQTIEKPIEKPNPML